jgi:hypothetical protein
MVLLTWAVLWLDRHFDQPLRRWLVSSGRRPAIA